MSDLSSFLHPPSPSNSANSELSIPHVTPPPAYSVQLEPQPSLHPKIPSRAQKMDPSSRLNIAHPYARLFAKKDEGKRRKIWNHALEKSLFTPYELSTLGAQSRRIIYVASLEAHIDRLHAKLLEIGFWPVAFSELEPFKGLNSKTAKSMVSGLQHDASLAKLKLLELERANESLERILKEAPFSTTTHAQPTDAFTSHAIHDS